MEHTHGGVGRRLVHKLGDYVGHWSVTGVVTICLGKTPESLVEALLERLPDGAAKMLVAVPYPSTILVGIGVTIVTIDLVRHRRRRDPPTLVAPPSPTPFVPPPPPVTVHVHLDGTAANRAIAAAAAALPAIAHHDSDKPIALPFPSIGADFIGRDAFLRDLHASLHHGAATRAAISSGAISGMGGIGKTCAAVEYAWAHRDRSS